MAQTTDASPPATSRNLLNSKRALAATVVVLIVAVAALLIYKTTGNASTESSPAREGYTSVGSVSGVQFWLRQDGSNLAIRSTGVLNGVCNRSAPAILGTDICAGSTSQGSIFAYLVPSTVTGVSIDATQVNDDGSGSATLQQSGALDVEKVLTHDKLVVIVAPGKALVASGNPTFTPAP